jgi:hypothetical protein
MVSTYVAFSVLDCGTLLLISMLEILHDSTAILCYEAVYAELP